MAIIILITTIKLNNDDSIVNIISLLASASSITLAIVSMRQSSVNNSESNKTFEKFNMKLDFMDKNITVIQNHILTETKEAVKKSQMPEEEKEEVIEILRKQQSIMEKNIMSFHNNRVNDTEGVGISEMPCECYVKKVYSKDDKLNNELNKLENILRENLGNRVRYRIEGIHEFKNDTLKDYSIEQNNVKIELADITIENKEIREVSFTDYNDRVDFWLYGNKVNRFNLDKNPNR